MIKNNNNKDKIYNVKIKSKICKLLMDLHKDWVGGYYLQTDTLSVGKLPTPRLPTNFVPWIMLIYQWIFGVSISILSCSNLLVLHINLILLMIKTKFKTLFKNISFISLHHIFFSKYYWELTISTFIYNIYIYIYIYIIIYTVINLKNILFMSLHHTFFQY